MVDRDVVHAKLDTIRRCLRRIEEAREPDRGLASLDAEDITLLNLQRAVQAAIDLAAHVVSTEKLGTPEKMASLFPILRDHGVIEAPLALRLQKIVGFRNIAVHEYQDIDPEIVESILARHLGDLTDFGQVVIGYYKLEPSR